MKQKIIFRWYEKKTNQQKHVVVFFLNVTYFLLKKVKNNLIKNLNYIITAIAQNSVCD